MIVVIGSPVLVGDGAALGPGATAAVTAAAAGSSVQLVGKVGDDAGGDEVLLALTQAGVGHAAILRDAAHATPRTGPGLPLEAADVELALRYLTEFRVVVLADEMDAATRATAIAAAAFSGAHVVDLYGDNQGAAAEDSPTLTAFGAAAADPSPIAGMAGRYAAALDSGKTAAEALALATGATD